MQLLRKADGLNLVCWFCVITWGAIYANSAVLQSFVFQKFDTLEDQIAGGFWQRRAKLAKTLTSIRRHDGSAGQGDFPRSLPPRLNFRFVHPWDVLVSKLQRLEEKDVEAFKLVLAKTGHPIEYELIRHLQKAVDLYRPNFNEETARGDMLANTRELWKILWNKELDVRAAIIRPALARSTYDPAPPDPHLKERLANLKLPEEEPLHELSDR
jgi:hypothetical protein